MPVNYLDNPWKPVPYTVFKNAEQASHILESGFQQGKFLPAETVAELQALFNETHDFSGNEKGGMFYSVYSQNLDYRKRIHEEITRILKPFLETYFTNYRVMLGAFVVKVAGPESEFYLHQDTTGLDEWKHSPMSLWIPLEDVDVESGCLGVIPKSHHFFTPYRSISFPAPFDVIQPVVKQYIQPLPMKKGEVLFFDNRILHNSYINTRLPVRMAVVCGIFQEDAPLITCHKEEYVCGGRVELIQHTDDFLMKYPNFLIDCQKRPHVGNSLGFVEDPYPEITETEFRELCRRHDIPLQTETRSSGPISCQLISEPKTPPQIENENHPTLIQKLAKLVGL